MPATPQINYFDGRQGYYTQFHKRQRLLAKGPKDEPSGPTYQAAIKRFAEIMHLSKADQAENGNLICTILELYAKHLRNQGRKRTLEMVQGCLESANDEFGRLKYEEALPRSDMAGQKWEPSVADQKATASANGGIR